MNNKIKATSIDKVNLIEILKMSQIELKWYLYEELKTYGYMPVFADGYIFAQGQIPVGMVAHMDTVHQEPRKIEYKRGVMSSPTGLGADDRAGIYGILHLIRKGYRPTVIFTEDEEIGGVGAEKFIKADIYIEDLKLFIELDRRGANDCVFYECDNMDFVEYIEKFGFKENFGSFSDISFIAPHYKIGAVNLSIGYEFEHTNKEYLNISDMGKTLFRVEKIFNNLPEEAFEYFEYQYKFGHGPNEPERNKLIIDDAPCKELYDCLIMEDDGNIYDVEDMSVLYYIDYYDRIWDELGNRIRGVIYDYNFREVGYDHFD